MGAELQDLTAAADFIQFGGTRKEAFLIPYDVAVPRRGACPSKPKARITVVVEDAVMLLPMRKGIGIPVVANRLEPASAKIQHLNDCATEGH